ncbi:levanase [Clostridium polyendosporum]|uniref:Levanase n=1 Tax=Clostridium polyendosporum TaxID=69208 RepID=A0A919VNA8_9CLOT|nr:glycoside hydrolase family 32 protein [Clostridium polyendosporum]GIM30378.1 levanase [Clostridium polyendosporum]
MKSKVIGALLLSLFFTSANFNLANAATSKTYRNEVYRPQYHYTPDTGWMNDPNGMVYYKGEYHLFYQYYPNSTVWGPMHWGHAVSKDLVNWTQEPISLYPDKNGDIFSGSVVVDWNNSSGFFNDTPDKTGLVALFTNACGAGGQEQSIAYSKDNGKTWTEYSANPVIPNQGTGDFRDPKVSWDDTHKKWVMTLAVQNRVEFYTSSNLKNWTKSGEFGRQGQGSHAGVWECPDLFQLPVDGQTGKSKWVLLLSLGASATVDSPPAGGSGMMYFVGDFDGNTFTADPQYTVTNNVGNNDLVKGYDLMPGDSVRVYDSQTGGNKLGEGTVPANQSSVSVQLTKDLGTNKGKAWISVVKDGKEQNRQEKDYDAEKAAINSGISGTTEVPAGQDITNAGFETGNLTGWTATGTEWSNKNITDITTWWGGLFNRSGKYHCLGYIDPATGGLGDAGTGTLESSEFTLGGNGQINFLVAGGDDVKNLYVTLETADGNELSQFKASGANSESYRRIVWDASAYIGQKLRIKVVDKSTGGWGHLNVDDFRVYNTVPYQNTLDVQPINWLDYGPDFYAGVTWSDTVKRSDVADSKYGKYIPDGKRILLGWMSNWAYANSTPTSTWRSAMTIPREAKLVATNDGYKLTQQPVSQLESLRQAPIKTLSDIIVQSGVSNLLSGVSGNTLEITSEFNVDSSTASEFGIKVKVGGNQETTIGYDPKTSTLFLDRSKSGGFTYPEYMPLKQQVVMKPVNGKIQLQIFVDKSSVEVFGNNGLVSITDQIFSNDSSKGVQLYSTGGKTSVNSLKVYPLKSATFTPNVNKTLPYDQNKVPNNIINGNFETGNLTGWTASGNSPETFAASSASTYWNDNHSYNKQGKYFLSSGVNGDDYRGVLKSNYFKLDGNGKINFLVSGGNQADRQYVALVRGSDDKELFTATGTNDEAFRRVEWDASKYIGEVLYIKVVDYNVGDWSHINVDDINVSHFNTNLKALKSSDGTWGEIGPYGIQGSSNSNGFYMASPNAKDFTYEAEISNLTDASKTNTVAGGLVFGADNDLTKAYVYNIDPSKNEIRLFNKKDGKDVVAPVKKTLSRDKSYKLKVVISGQNIKVYLDDEKIIDVNVTDYTGGKVGLDVSNGSAAFQNVYLR